MRRIAVCLVFSLLTVSAARAADATKEEERFLKDLVDALGADSEDVRQAAEEALVRMGDKAADHLVENVRKVDRDALDAAARVLIRIGYPALQRIRALEKLPSGRHGDALAKVIEALSGGGGIGGFGDPDPAVTAQVEAILAELPSNSFSTDDPSVGRLAALGRAAIPSLIPLLSPSQGHSLGFRDSAAVSALGEICGPEDTPKLSALLDQGWTRVAAVMKDIGDPACVPALIRALKENRMTHDVGDAIRSFRDPRTRTPIVRFLEEHVEGFPYGTSGLLDALVEFRATEAIPTIKRMAKSLGKDDDRNRRIVYCCRALVQLGDPAGFPPLIGALTLSGSDEWLVNWSGEALNAATGQTFWARGVDGAEARRQYQEWYDGVKSHLEWDAAMRQFVVRD